MTEIVSYFHDELEMTGFTMKFEHGIVGWPDYTKTFGYTTGTLVETFAVPNGVEI